MASRRKGLVLANSAKLPTRYGDFRIYSFSGADGGAEHVAIVKGRIAGLKDVLVRLHSECLTGDALA